MQIEDYRVSNGIALVFQVVYTFKVETKEKDYTHKMTIVEFQYIPSIYKNFSQGDEIKDIFMIQRVDLRKSDSIFKENTFRLQSPSLDPLNSESTFEIKGFISTQQQVMSKVK